MSKLEFKFTVNGKPQVKPLEEIFEIKIKEAISATKVEQLRQESFLKIAVIKKLRNQVTRAKLTETAQFIKVINKLVELDELCAQEFADDNALILSNDYRQEARIVKALAQELGINLK
jgi:hypothetical protein